MILMINTNQGTNTGIIEFLEKYSLNVILSK